MDYYFKGFQFKSDQLVLIKMEQTVSLRANEAKLLTLLLSDPQRVFSKEQILENVWAGKSVAEQSIFQNISNLRSIFGDDAITTHPKKGYQWRIPLELPPVPAIEKLKQRDSTTQKYLAWPIIFAVFIVIVIGYLTPQQVAIDAPVISLMPIELNTPQNAIIDSESKDSYNQLLIDALNKSESLSLILGENGQNFNEFQASASLLVEAVKKENKADFILSTKVKNNQSEIVITFNLLTENNAWQSIVSGDSLESAIEQLARQINIIIESNFLLTHKENLKRIHAQLKLMHDEFPNNLSILQRYIKSAQRLGSLNEALLLIEQLEILANKANSQNYLAEAYMMKSYILIVQEHDHEAKLLLNKADKTFSALNDITGLTNVASQKAMLLFNEENYQALKTTLLDAIYLLKNEDMHFQQIEQTMMLVVYANKFKEITDRDKYLAAAKRLLDIYNLPKEHYSRIYFQQGLFAERAGDDATAEKYYRWVIELFSAEQEWWHKERAQYHLSQILIGNNRISAAVDLFENEGDLTTKEKVILASVYQSWHKPQKAIDLAKQAYRESVLSGELITSLDAALLLAELSTVDSNLVKQTYIHYLKNEAPSYWLDYSTPRLKQLGFSPL